MENSNYKVKFSDFSQRYYVKRFAKKYRSNWSKTQVDIVNICQRINNLLAIGRSQAELIKSNGEHQLIKLEFAIEGTKKSPKKSGCRALLWVDKNQLQVIVLMVYHKNDVQNEKETLWWKIKIKNNFSKVAKIFFKN